MRAGAARPAPKQWWWAYFGGNSPAEPAVGGTAGESGVELPTTRGPLAETSALVAGEDGKADAGGEPGLGAPPAEASLSTTVFNLCNTVLGAGAMQMPFAFAEVGIAGGLVVLTFVYCLSILTGIMLCDTARHFGAGRFGATYGGLVRLVFGEWGTARATAARRGEGSSRGDCTMPQPG
eukprot:gene8809-12179_t